MAKKIEDSCDQEIFQNSQKLKCEGFKDSKRFFNSKIWEFSDHFYIIY
jgi:hypothetical protein